MTEEIKEIIDYLIDEECTRRIKCITIEESKQLLDYIANLQQEKEKLKQTLHNITINGVEEENTTVLDLINENKKLKECYCNRTDCSGRLKDSKKYDSVYQEKEDYKSRCEKAMVHIEESLDILKGDSDIPITTGNVRNRYLKPVLNIINGSDEK